MGATIGDEDEELWCSDGARFLDLVLSSRSDFVFASDVDNPLSGFFFLPSKE